MPSTRMSYLIWATDHDAWWAPDRQGYTNHVALAGHYDAEDVADILANDIMNEQRVCRVGEAAMMSARIRER